MGVCVRVCYQDRPMTTSRLYNASTTLVLVPLLALVLDVLTSITHAPRGLEESYRWGELERW